MKFIVVLSTLSVAMCSPVELTKENFNQLVKESGKAAFVKFYAPWCGHCKRLAPDWTKLGEAFADSETTLIGKVDCTNNENQELCQEYEVKGFPTLKTIINGAVDDYGGERAYKDLKDFADKNLGPSCGSKNKDLCEPDELKELEELEALGKESIERRIATAESKMADVNEAFELEVSELQTKYEKLLAQKNGNLERLKGPLRMLRRVSFPDDDEAKDAL